MRNLMYTLLPAIHVWKVCLCEDELTTCFQMFWTWRTWNVQVFRHVTSSSLIWISTRGILAMKNWKSTLRPAILVWKVCQQTGLNHQHFFADVLDLADVKCSGQQTCDILMPEPTFDELRPCDEELRVYLEVAYSCVKGMWPGSWKSNTILSRCFGAGWWQMFRSSKMWGLHSWRWL